MFNYHDVIHPEFATRAPDRDSTSSPDKKG